MKVRNTRELVQRARGHARADHVKQGTYGRGAVNGHVVYKGCAIGCLSTPHRKPELRKFLRAVFGGPKGTPNSLNHVEYFGRDEFAMLKDLGAEFGIDPTLARCAEAIFERLPTHGEAIDFIPAFASALNEGASFTQRKLAKVWPEIIGRSVGVDETPDEYNVPWPSQFVARDARDRFLEYLRSVK